MGVAGAFIKEALLTLLFMEVLFQLYVQIVTSGVGSPSLSSDDQQRRQTNDSPRGPFRPVARKLPLSSSGTLPRCRVLVNNKIANHAEIFESIMHLPGEMLSLTRDNSKCDPNRLIFDFSLKADGMTWRVYYEDTLKSTYDDKHPSIMIGDLVRYMPETKDPKYAAIVEATCHCAPSDIAWLKGYERRRCVLHRKCLRLQGDNRALSASPFNPRFFLPDKLPPFKREKKPPKPPYNLCVLGRNYRRNFDFVREYFDSHKGDDDFMKKFVIQIFGSSEIKPPVLRPYNQKWVTKTNITQFDVYQRRVAEKCDALLALVDRVSHNEYFVDQLTGTVPQASAYNIPIVIHEDLAAQYGQYLPEIYETHEDHNRTFVEALDRLIKKFDSIQPKKKKEESADAKKAVA